MCSSDLRHEADLLPEGSQFLGSIFPTRNLEAVEKLAARKVTAFSTDCIPRTTRAQAMDTLSSQANITGYRGVLLGALALPKYFPMFMTAAGNTLQAKVFVIGAGVAGLQAIATARRLGASVTATDVRPEVKEQIESVGGKYVGIGPGGSETYLHAGSTIEFTQSAIVLENLINKFFANFASGRGAGSASEPQESTKP